MDTANYFYNKPTEIKMCSNEVLKMPETFCEKSIRPFPKVLGIVIDVESNADGGFWFCIGSPQNKITVTESIMPTWIVIGALVEVDFETGIIELKDDL